MSSGMDQDIIVRAQLPLQRDGLGAEQEIHIQGPRGEPVWCLRAADHG
jgi:hypothetical protein